MQESCSRSAQEFIDRLHRALKTWQPSYALQQDDIILIVVDVV